jgi:hypothetical protein
MRPAASSPRSSRTRVPRGAEYPFGRAEGSFFLGGGEDPAWEPAQPLLAYGANASPARLAAKLPGARVAALAGTLRGWAVVHSAHVSPYGSVPATLVRDARSEAPVHVLLLDDLGSLDGTEPNYDRVRLEGLDLEVQRLGRIEAIDAYISKWGPLLVEGEPVALGAMDQSDLRRIIT